MDEGSGGVILACWGMGGRSAGWQAVWGGGFTMNFGVFVRGSTLAV